MTMATHDGNVVHARTAFILPFEFFEVRKRGEDVRSARRRVTTSLDLEIFRESFKKRLLETMFLRSAKNSDQGPNFEELELWRERSLKNAEILELDPQFRATLGLDRGEDEGEPDVRRWDLLTLTKGALRRVSKWRLQIKQPEKTKDAEGKRSYEEVISEVQIKDVSVVLFPLGTGVFIFDVAWCGPEGKAHQRSVSPKALEAALYYGRYTQEDDKDKPGWVIPISSAALSSAGHCTLDSCGPISDVPLSLIEIAERFLGDGSCQDEDASLEYVANLNWSRSRHGIHHSAIVLDGLAPDPLGQSLWRWSHAYRDGYDAPEKAEETLEIVGRRADRCIVVTREGALSLAWRRFDDEAEDPGRRFREEGWADRFQQIYRLLHIHVLSERLIVARMSGRIQAQLSNGGRPIPVFRGEEGMEAFLEGSLETARDAFASVVSLGAADCGGLTDYSEFFRTTRRCLQSQEMLNEVRAELRELTDIYATLRSEAAERRKDRNEMIVKVAGALILPITLTAAFGDWMVAYVDQGRGWYLFAVAGAILAIVGTILAMLSRSSK